MAWSVVGNLSRAGTQAIFLIVLARLGSIAQAGEYALALAVTAPVFVFLNLGLRQLQGTETSDDLQFADYLGLRVVTIAAGLLVTGVGVWWMQFSPSTTAFILAVAVYRSLESLADTFHGLFQRGERNDLIGRSEGTKGVVSLATFTAVLWTSGDVVLALIVVAVARLVLLAWQELRWTKGVVRRVPRFHWNSLAPLVKVAVPLGVVAMFVSLATNMPRYFLAEFHGEQLVGIYAIMELFLQFVQTVSISLQQATSASLSRSYLEGGGPFYRHLGKLIGIAVGWGIVALVGTFCVGSTVLSLCLGQDMGAYHGVFVLLIAASIVLNSRCFFTAAMVVMRRTRLQAILTGISTLSTALFAAVLIPRYALQGAAWTVMLSGAVFCLLTGLVLLADYRASRAATDLPTQY